MPSPVELLIPPEQPLTPEVTKLVRATVVGVVDGKLRVTLDLDRRNVDVEHWAGDPQAGDDVLVGVDEIGDEWVVAGVDADPVWQAWSPDMHISFVLGAGGAITARYIEIGKLVHYRLHIRLGTSPTMPSNPTFTLPTPTSPLLASAANFQPMGDVNLRDASPAALYFGYAVLSNTTTVLLRVSRADLTYLADTAISATVPITWAVDDEIFVKGWYEAA